MATVGDILACIDTLAPFRLAMGFDNPGLIVGNREQAVTTALVAVDATLDVVEEAHEKGAELLITHHPLLFQATKKLVEADAEQKILRRLIQYDISLIAVHTNYDTAVDGVCWNLARACGIKMERAEPLSTDGVKDVLLLENVEEGPLPLGVFPGIMAARKMAEEPNVYSIDTNQEGIWGYGLVGPVDAISTQALAQRVKDVLAATCVKYTGPADREIKRLAAACGSGVSVFDAALRMGADAIVTGEVRYNEALFYTQMGLSIIEAGHFDTEKSILDDLTNRLQNSLLGLQYNVRVFAAENSMDVYTGAV
ncbi:Nif3-like dinuclear metal center hexameric protein [Eubacteriales bacterium OttesenSCG-928-M02]|nr:Nif3-like dinuclear metal center hexameric protein [Eubacteriales bacterium OttesenSCG-928-M02]